MKLTKDFKWGAATASYQVEGAVQEDGRGMTTWDNFCSVEGKVLEGHDGGMACDHYHRYQEDILIMEQIGIKAYRFSIAWSRILPEGIGRVNQKGIDFYNNLIDGLLAQKIEPCITLFHWDLPYALYSKGGWQNPESPNWFAEYALEVAKAFGDRVKIFITFNEPQCFIGLGHITGEHAPGNIMSKYSVLKMAHHVMLAHGKAVQAIRSVVKDVQIGYAPTSTVACPASSSKEDVEAARKAYFEVKDTEENYMWNVSWWSDPVLLGKYPEDGLKAFEPYLPPIHPKDLEVMSQPIEFYGQNIYNGYFVEADGNGGYSRRKRQAGYPRTSIGWPIVPESLYWGPKFLYERYGKPIYITENGLSNADIVSLDGKVHDPQRIDFMKRYLKEMKKSMEDGTDIRGYFAWSLMDNFEWSKGYTERFGMVHVDYETQQRILKDSAYWYQKLIQNPEKELEG